MLVLFDSGFERGEGAFPGVYAKMNAYERSYASIRFLAMCLNNDADDFNWAQPMSSK